METITTITADTVDQYSLNDLSEAFFKLIESNRPQFSPFLFWCPLITSTKQASMFLTGLERKIRLREAAMFVIFVRNQLIGMITFQNMHAYHRKLNMGYLLDKDHQNKGIMRRACQNVINFAFFELKIQRIEIQCTPNNSKSQKLALSLGFTNEGVLRQAEKIGDCWHDLIILSLLAQDLSQRNP